MGGNVCRLSTHVFVQKIMNLQQWARVTEDTDMNKRPCFCFRGASFPFQGAEFQVKMKYAREDTHLEKIKEERGERLASGAWEGLSGEVAFGKRPKELNRWTTCLRGRQREELADCVEPRKGGEVWEVRIRAKTTQFLEMDRKPWRDFRKGEMRPNLDFKRIVLAAMWKWTVMGVRVAEMVMWRSLKVRPEEDIKRQWTNGS